MGGGGGAWEGAEGRLRVSLVSWMALANRNVKVAQLLRIINAARSMYEISTHASMYIPMSIPPVLPRYVELDRSSQWQTSALLSTALETTTLPSRLRNSSRNHATFDVMEAALNVNGTQRIAQLQCSIVDPSVSRAEKSRFAKGCHDRQRLGSKRIDLMLDEDDAQTTTVDLDMDFFCGRYIRSVASLSQHHQASHTFGQVETLRGGFEDEDEAAAGSARKRRRLADLPVVEKSVCNIRTRICHWLLHAHRLAGCMYFQYLRTANHRIRLGTAPR